MGSFGDEQKLDERQVAALLKLQRRKPSAVIGLIAEHYTLYYRLLVNDFLKSVEIRRKMRLTDCV